jgi:HEAT repeat protein
MSWLDRAASPIPERLAPLLEAMSGAGRLETEASLRLLDERGVYEKDDLNRALYDETEASDVREVAAWVLGRVGDRRDSTTLARSLGDLQPSVVRRAAVQALGLLPSRAASYALIARLDEDPELEVRAAAAAALGTGLRSRLASRRGVDALCRRLTDPAEDDEVRGFSAEALGHVLAYGPRSVKPLGVLRAALTDPSPDVRFWAAFALGQAGDISDVARLQQLEADGTEVFGGATVADEARDSIEQIRAREAS